MAINIFRRHNKANCPIASWSIINQCKCPLWVDDGRLDNGTPVKKQTLRTRSKSAADAIVRGWQERGSTAAVVVKPRGTPVVDAIRQFLRRWEKNKGAAEGTIGLYQTAFLRSTTMRRPNAKRMLTLEGFCEQKGIVAIEDITLDDLEELQRDWHTNGFEQSTINQKTIHLKTLWTFLGRRGIATLDLDELVVQKMSSDGKTIPFSREEMERILEAAKTPLDRAMVLFLRYSGFRILDAITCPMNRIHDGNRIMVCQRKVRNSKDPWVSGELPGVVIEALQQFNPKSETYWFWDGRESHKNIRQWWYKRLKKIFVAAGVPEGHPHSLRHTFAVENILAGMEPLNVSKLLGHSSLLTTERHYLYWIKLRQQRLQQQQRDAHAADPLLQKLAGTISKVGTIQVQKGRRKIASA